MKKIYPALYPHITVKCSTPLAKLELDIKGHQFGALTISIFKLHIFHEQLGLLKDVLIPPAEATYTKSQTKSQSHKDGMPKLIDTNLRDYR